MIFLGSGSGTFNIVIGDVGTCSGRWSGTYTDVASFTNYTFPPDDEPITNVQINVPAPKEGNYTTEGNVCSGAGSSDFAGYLGIMRGVPRDIDLTQRAVQTFTVQPTPDCTNIGYTTCSGSSQWNVYVEVFEPTT